MRLSFACSMDMLEEGMDRIKRALMRLTSGPLLNQNPGPHFVVTTYSPIAQLVERLTVNQNVRGSSPRRGAKFQKAHQPVGFFLSSRSSCPLRAQARVAPVCY